MQFRDQVRRWQRVGLSALLSLVVHLFAAAQTDPASAPKKPAHSTATTAKKHSSGGQASTKHTSSKKGSKSSRGKKGKKRGQQAIDSTRARQIQEALIREHYMNGEPTGSWDATTQAAMQKYQADQGWQSKTTPDSRALIKLGLGPSNDHLLNPESAMTSTPAAGDPKATTKAGAGQSIPPQ